VFTGVNLQRFLFVHWISVYKLVVCGTAAAHKLIYVHCKVCHI